jgi:hypothetical protein
MGKLLELLWSQNTASGRWIITLILLAGTWGALSAVRHRARYYGRERRWLDSVRDRLQRARAAREGSPAEGSDEVVVEIPQTSSPLIELQELAEGVPRDTLIGDRLGTIIKMQHARAKVNVDALQQSTIMKESASWSLSLPAYVVSLVMMLGLLGTFIGLSFMVIDIQQAMPGDASGVNTTQWAASVSSLGRILAGKKTAFSATLAGIAVSIFVSALNYSLARAQSTLYSQLERFTTEDLLPATIPAFDDETPWERLSAQLGDSFQNLKDLATDQARSAEQLAAVEMSFAVVIGHIEAITQRAATAPLQGMAGEIASVIAQLTQVNGAVIGLTEKLPQVLAAFRQTHHATLTEIQNAMQAQQAGIDRLTRSIQTGSGVGSRYLHAGLVAAGAVAMLLIVVIATRL